MEEDEIEMSKEELEDLIREQVEDTRLISPGLQEKYRQLHSLLKRREKQTSSFLKLCQSVAACEGVVKELYTFLEWEYRDSDSDNESTGSGCTVQLQSEQHTHNSSKSECSDPQLSKSRVREKKKKWHPILNREATVVLTRLSRSELIRALRRPPAQINSSESESLSHSDSDMQWLPGNGSRDSDSSLSDFNTGSRKRRKIHENGRERSRSTPQRSGTFAAVIDGTKTQKLTARKSSCSVTKRTSAWYKSPNMDDKSKTPPQASTRKTPETNTTNTKTPEAKATKTKPPEANTTKTKPSEANTMKTKPSEANTMKTKPPEANTTKPKPSEANTMKTKPSEANTMKTKPSEANTMKTKPSEANTTKTKPPEANTMKTKPSEANTMKTKPPEAITTKTKPSEANTMKTKPSEANTMKTKPSEANTMKTKPSEANTMKTKPPEAITTKTKPPEAITTKTKPSEAITTKTKPSEANTMKTKPSEANTMKTKPSEANTMKTKPSEANTMKTKPSEANTMKTKPPEANSNSERKQATTSSPPVKTAVGPHTNRTAPIKPAGEVTVNMKVLARKKELSWQQGKIVEIITKDDGRLKYKVTFEEKGKRLVSGHHIAFDCMPVVEQLFIGARVVVKSTSEKPEFMPGVMAELPNRKNRMRFLVFIDNCVPVYVGLPLLRLVCKPLADPLSDILDQTHQSYMREYLKHWPYPPQTQYKIGQSVNAEVDGTMQKCEVVAVDCSLMEVSIKSNQHKEWIYRGSIRLEHMSDFKQKVISNNNEEKSKSTSVKG